jgi:protocatechuate 3,4-dioxygenase beta subunit
LKTSNPIIFILLSIALAACSPGAPATPAALPSVQPVTQAAPQLTQDLAGAAAIDCSSPAALTPAMTEGPYFKANSPERASLLEQGMTGTRLTLSGYVLTADCQPIPGSLLDFWQADDKGNYDNAGYRLRGHQFSDSSGHYQLETVVPGLYPGRTEHIHVKVQPPGGPELTTQLFFPGVAENERDSIFSVQLLLTVESQSRGEMQATYNFVVSSK